MSDAQASMAVQEEPLYVVRPSGGWSFPDLRELWRYRGLVYFLTWRDIKVRYKQTLLGAAWAILKPFFSMVVFSILFGRLAQIPTDDVPGPIFYFTGLLPWLLFQDGISKAGTSLVSGRHLITKVYFPRLAVPLASVLAGLVDFGLSFLVLIGMMAFYGIWAPTMLWTLPLFLLLTLITALGVGLWLSALNVSYRDIGYVIPFLVQVWLYASPVVYSTNLIPEGLGKLVYGLNPMAGVVQGFRWAMLGAGQPSPTLLASSTLVSLLLLVTGLIYFRRMERSFADVV
jgi:lipopolysaccharide transport system permease protein